MTGLFDKISLTALSRTYFIEGAYAMLTFNTNECSTFFDLLYAYPPVYLARGLMFVGAKHFEYCCTTNFIGQVMRSILGGYEST